MPQRRIWTGTQGLTVSLASGWAASSPSSFFPPTHQPWPLGQPGSNLCCRLGEMLGHLSPAVHPHLPSILFHLPHQQGRWRDPGMSGPSGRPVENQPPFLSSRSHLQLLIFVMPPITSPSSCPLSAQSPLSQVGSSDLIFPLPFTPPATPSLTLRTSFCFSPPVFLLHSPQKHRETTYCSLAVPLHTF